MKRRGSSSSSSLVHSASGRKQKRQNTTVGTSAWTEGLHWFSDLFSTECVSSCTHRYECNAGDRTCICGNTNLRSIYQCLNIECGRSDASDFMSEVKEWCDDQYGNSRWLTSSVIYAVPASTPTPRTMVGPAYRPTASSGLSPPASSQPSTPEQDATTASITVEEAPLSYASSSFAQQQSSRTAEAQYTQATDPAMPPSVSSANAPVIIVGSTVPSRNSDTLPSPASSPLLGLDENMPPSFTNTTPTSEPASNSEDDNEGLAVGPIVGIVFGIVFTLVLLSIVFWLYRKQRKQRHANRRSGLLWPERRDTVGSMAVFSGLNMSFASIRHSSPIYVDDNVRSKQIEDEQEKGTEQGTSRRVPKLTLIGGPVSSNGSNQAGPFCPRTSQSSNEPTTQGLETVLHVPPEQLRYLQELLLTKGPGSITSADGERFLTAQAQNDPRLKAWLDSALQAHYSNSSTKSDPPYNVKVDALVDSLGLRTPSKGASRTASDDGHSISS